MLWVYPCVVPVLLLYAGRMVKGSLHGSGGVYSSLALGLCEVQLQLIQEESRMASVGVGHITPCAIGYRC